MSKRIDPLLRKGFRSSKCKTLLKLTVSRIRLLRNKRDALVKQARRDVAQLLQSGQETNARIRVEHVYREQNVIAAYDLIEQFCETAVNQLPIIESQKFCPTDLKEAISSLIFAAPRCSDLEELQQLRDLFAAKYGKQFVAAAADLHPDCGVNREIIEKLSSHAPAGEVKLKLIKVIAAEHKIDWNPEKAQAELLKAPEDLLDGQTRFFSASQASITDVIPNIDSVSESPKTSPSAESHPSTTDEPSSTSSSPHYSHGGEDVRPAPEKFPPLGRYNLLPQDVLKKGARHQSQLQANLSSVSKDISETEQYAMAKMGGRMDYKDILDPNAKTKEDRREYHETTVAQVESKVLPSKLEKHISSLDSPHSEVGIVFTRGRKFKYGDVASAAQEALAASAAQEVVKFAKRDSRNGANNGMMIIDSSDSNVEVEEILSPKWKHDLSSVCSSAGTMPKEQIDPHTFTRSSFDDDNHEVAQASFYEWNREDTSRPSISYEVTKDQSNPYTSTGPTFDDNIRDNTINDFILSASTHIAQDDHFKSTDHISNRAQKQSILFSQDEMNPVVEGLLDNINELGYGRKSRSKAGLSTPEKTEVDRDAFKRHSQFPDFDRYLEPDIFAEKMYSDKASLKCSNQNEEIPVKAAQIIHGENSSGLHFSPDREHSYQFEAFRKLKWHSRSTEDSDSSSQFSEATPQHGYNVEIGTKNANWHKTTRTHARWEHSDDDLSPVVKDKSYHGNGRRSARSVRSQQRREHTSFRQEGEVSSNHMSPFILESAEVNNLKFSIASQSKLSPSRTPIVTPAALDLSERDSNSALLLSKSSSVSSTSESSLQPNPSSKLPSVPSPAILTSFSQVSLASYSLEEALLSSKTSSMEVEKQQESSKDRTISSSTSTITPTMHLPDDDEFTARFEALRRKR